MCVIRGWFSEHTIGVLLDSILRCQRAGGLDAVQDELVSSLRLGVVQGRAVDGVLGNHDGLGLVAGAARHSLPHFLTDEWHERMDHCQRRLEGRVEGLDGRLALLGGAVADDGLGVLNIDVAELAVPVLVDNGGRLGELAVGNGNVDILGSLIHLVQDPALGQRLARDGALLRGDKVGGKAAENVLGGLEDLVAELAIAVDGANLKVNVAATSGGINHGETQGVSATLWDAVGERSLLVLGRSLNLGRVQVAKSQFIVQGLQRDTGNDIERVNDVAQTLGHFTALGITDKAVAKDLLKGDLASQFQAEHDHASNPKEQDIPASFKDAGGEQLLKVLRLVGPAESAERP